MFKSAGRYHYVASETVITVSLLNLSEFSSDHNQNYPDGLPRSTIDITQYWESSHGIFAKTWLGKVKKVKTHGDVLVDVFPGFFIQGGGFKEGCGNTEESTFGVYFT